MTRKFIRTLCAAVAAVARCGRPRRRPPNARARTRSAPHAFSRVDAATSPRVGLKSFPQTLPLEDHEVVLTFDDGPWPARRRKVLAALARECVRATFFLIGKPASEHPELVRRIAALGHTVGHHTWSHPNLKYMKPDAAVADIDKGFAAVEKALHGSARRTTPSTPFFRFPYFEMTPATLDLLQKRGIAVFGADLWASDWNPMTPAQQLKLLTERLKAARKGIILLHDPKAQTAAMLPAFLRYLRDNQLPRRPYRPGQPRSRPERSKTRNKCGISGD